MADFRPDPHPDFRNAFQNLEQETPPTALPVQGRLPAWLQGALLRTGPATFSLPQGSYSHWFDGLGMLQRFGFDGGRASYTGRFLQSPDRTRSLAAGRPQKDEFVTVPARSLLGRVITLVEPERQFGRNGIINVQRVGQGEYLALTENPLAMRFDPDSLATLGCFDWPDALSSVFNMVTTAHACYDAANGCSWNLLARLNPFNPQYLITRLDDGQTARQQVASVPTDALSYMHGLGMSEHYIILTEYPLVTTPLALFLMPLTGTGYIDNYRWRPERGTRLRVIDKRSGRLVGTWVTEPFFCFHHVHAQEVGDELVLDLSVYEGGSGIISALSLDAIRGAQGGHLPWSGLKRLRVPLKGGEVRSELLAEPMLEMPQINADRCATDDYRYVYGVSWTAPGQFVNALVKVDVQQGRHTHWHEDGCWPGEPVFVAAPAGAQGGAEDAGVNLSVVYDGRVHRSFLLVLDAQSFTEMARLPLPVAIPPMLHGQFFAGRPLGVA